MMMKYEKIILSNTLRVQALKKEITNLTTLKLKTSINDVKRQPGKLFATQISNPDKRISNHNISRTLTNQNKK